MLEVEAKYLSERGRREDWCAVNCLLVGDSIAIGQQNGSGRSISMTGNADVGELQSGVTYRFYGKFKTNEFRGEKQVQFQFQSFVQVVRHDRSGIIEYLVAVGKGNGIGTITAEKAWKQWGPDAVSVIRNSPQELEKVNPRITEQQMMVVGQKLRELQQTEATSIELTALLKGRGFPRSTSKKCIKAYGNLASTVIKKDPYRLMQFRGCGFARCDAMYLELGQPHDSLRRQALCAWYEVASCSDGDTWFPIERCEYAINRVGVNANSERAIELATRLGKISPDHYGALAVIKTEGSSGPLNPYGDRRWVAEGRKAQSEYALASYVSDCLAEGVGEASLWPDPSLLEVSNHQREKVTEALTGRLAILGGSPGTGKTYTVAQIVKALLRSGRIGLNDIAIGAPTGKAAVRVSENLQAAGVPLVARTWHSLLGVGEQDSENGEFTFRFKAGNPWPFRVVIGDESSMVDTSLMCAIFAARARGTHVLLVGDVHQLPPVGHGAPFRDLINAKVPYGELTDIMRNSGGIVEACAAIRDEEPWGAGDNLHLIERSKDEEQLAAIEKIIDKARAAGYDPIWDCQVLTAVNLRSNLSRKAVNKLLQHQLNPRPAVPGTVFRVGDKIVCTKNGYFIAEEAEEAGQGNEVYVANGELAKVLDIVDGKMLVQLDAPKRIIRVPLAKAKKDDGGSSDESKSSTGCNFDLAYALSTHKSQGSEFPVVIVMLDKYPGARAICDRSWIYTAISRAREKCYLVGLKSTAMSMCRKNNIAKRKTFLREQVQLNRVEELLEMI